MEIIGRKEVIAGNAVTRRIVEGLGNARLIEVLTFGEPETKGLEKTAVHELMRMKLTAKVARHGFDLRYFFETIDVTGKGTVKFV